MCTSAGNDIFMCYHPYSQGETFSIKLIPLLQSLQRIKQGENLREKYYADSPNFSKHGSFGCICMCVTMNGSNNTTNSC